jgi:mRNA-degrading endonuclease YafQ of YafQ-DinJ toxin-antitoxin module
MIEVILTDTFAKTLSKFETDLYEEVLEKIELFKDPKNHKRLKVHKLKGSLSNKRSFSVNYKIRIVFIYGKKKEAYLLSIGDHDVYK